MNRPPLLESLACDPLLDNVKLIAEAWDAGGVSQVGSFPRRGPLGGMERQVSGRSAFLFKGNLWEAENAAMRIAGSFDMYGTGGQEEEGKRGERREDPELRGLQFLREFPHLPRWLYPVRSVFL